MSDNNSPKINSKEIEAASSEENKVADTNEALEATESQKPSNEKKSLARDFIESIELVAISFAVIVLLFSLVFRVCTVDGRSMQDTLEHGDVVICSNLFYSPQRQDIIVLHQNSKNYNEPLVKRVIGLPGDTVNIEYLSNNSMRVTVIDKNGNRQVLEENYIKTEIKKPYYLQNTSVLVEEGTLFVMGDNRYESADSRVAEIGLIDMRRVLGKIIFRVSPINKIGTVS